MPYSIWTDAESYCDAEFQIIVETESNAKKEKRDLVKMDCGKIICQYHATIGEADLFADFVADLNRPTKIKTAYAKFQAKGL